MDAHTQKHTQAASRVTQSHQANSSELPIKSTTLLPAPRPPLQPQPSSLTATTNHTASGHLPQQQPPLTPQPPPQPYTSQPRPAEPQLNHPTDSGVPQSPQHQRVSMQQLQEQPGDGSVLVEWDLVGADDEVEQEEPEPQEGLHQ